MIARRIHPAEQPPDLQAKTALIHSFVENPVGKRSAASREGHKHPFSGFLHKI
jgi:hypothetical protein